MKRAGVTVVVITGLLGCTGVRVPDGLPPLCANPCTVTVTVKDRPGGGYDVALNPSDKLRLSAKAAHRVVWTFQNDSGKDMDLGISKFKPNPPPNTVNPDWDDDPFDSGDPRHVKIARGNSGNVQARVKKNAKATRTYKYDILDGATVLKDPEIEIRP